MSSRKSNRNVKRQDYSREDFGCKSCDSYECKGCDDKVVSESSSEGSEVERWIATLSDIEDYYQTPAADSGAASFRDQTLTQVNSNTEELPTIVMADAAEIQHL